MKQTTLFIILTILLGSCDTKTSKTARPHKKDITIDTSLYSLVYLDNLNERLTIKNYDNSLHDYINSNPNKVDSIRKVVYLLPFGNMKPEIEKIIQSELQYLTAFLQLDVKILERIPFDSIKKITSIQTRMVPSSDFDYYSNIKGGTPTLREQIQASSFIESVIKKNLPKDAVAVLGITEHDIYNPKYNYLFGLSELKSGTGLVSTFRLIDYGQTTKDNIRKVISKQIVNLFSIANVKDFKCVLNYHNDIDELTQEKFDLSPRALEKLKYAIGFNYTKRFEDLAKFWAKENNTEEANYYKECVKRSRKTNN